MSDEYVLNINATENEGNISINSEKGEVIWDENQIRFFHPEFSNNPLWYNKRVIYGKAEDGEYVELDNWERTPSIHLSISDFPVFIKEGEWNEQYIDIGIEEESKDGFRVRARLETEGNAERDNEFQSAIVAYASGWTSGDSEAEWLPPTDDGCTRLEVSGNTQMEQEWVIVACVAAVELWEYNNGDWEYIEEIYRKTGNQDDDWNIDYTADSGVLSPGRYRARIYATGSVQHVSSESNASWYTRIRGLNQQETYQSAGSESGIVNWIAVENAE